MLFHMFLYKKQGNVKSKLFLVFFSIYFLINLYIYIFTYQKCFIHYYTFNKKFDNNFNNWDYVK